MHESRGKILIEGIEVTARAHWCINGIESCVLSFNLIYLRHLLRIKICGIIDKMICE